MSTDATRQHRAVRVWRRVLGAGVALGTAAVVAACGTPSNVTPTPSPSPTPRPFTVMSTDPIRVTDPAAITDNASTVMSLNVFQRLMTADPGGSVLKPDAARDCLFTAATTYTCTLNKDLFFHNGHPLTSSDVKFSIERATRLDVPETSGALLSSLRRIDTPDPLTVRFQLSRPDTQFGWALAAPAASIVDEEVYDADVVRDPKESAVGSGPFEVARFTGSELDLVRFEDYVGRTPAGLGSLVYRVAPDSATVEDAISRRAVDVVWRGLDAAAVTRLSNQVRVNGSAQTDSGYFQRIIGGTRVQQLLWNPSSPMRARKRLRQAVAVALQGDRTSDSVVPAGVPGHIAAFPAGGKATPKVTWKNRVKLTLSYDPTAPNAGDIAAQIRSRLELTGGLSVQLRRGDHGADLALVDRKAWTPTAVAWLQPYTDHPLAGSATTVEALTVQFRRTVDDAAARAIVGTLQRQAAADATVLPISQSDEYLYLRGGVEMNGGSWGPGWQLGLFGISGG